MPALPTSPQGIANNFCGGVPPSIGPGAQGIANNFGDCFHSGHDAPAAPAVPEVPAASVDSHHYGGGTVPFDPAFSPQYPAGTRPFDPAIPAYYETDDGNDPNVGAIVGGVFGGLAAIVLAYLLYRYLKKRKEGGGALHGGGFMADIRRRFAKKDGDVEMQHNSTLD
ncbi:MAG: hypothetical protein Q9183_006128 [Haloplaca sp. 2 TL-2023]